jgi:hypothetical protein
MHAGAKHMLDHQHVWLWSAVVKHAGMTAQHMAQPHTHWLDSSNPMSEGITYDAEENQ